MINHMVREREMQLNDLLSRIAESLDISATDYERAVRSYQAVGSCLEDGFGAGAYPGCDGTPKIYPQGSIRLGTVVKPLREDSEAAYDLDLVCELQYSNIDLSPGNAKTVKYLVGNQLKSNGIYRAKLEPEGKRCWTLEYAETSGVGFHIDVLPCIPQMLNRRTIDTVHPGYVSPTSAVVSTGIHITDKDEETPPQYSWSSGNPIGYAEWFRARNTTFNLFAPHQKQMILKSGVGSAGGTDTYRSLQEVPNELVRTPLQRSIQILKRHRDVRFKNNACLKPISMIITTLCAQLYSGEDELLGALRNIVTKLSYYAPLVGNRYAQLDKSVAHLGLIQRTTDGKWHIPNPVDPQENFADRWHEEENGVKDARARAFFQWVGWVKQDIEAPLNDGSLEELQLQLGAPSRGQTLPPIRNYAPQTNGASMQGVVPRRQHSLSRFNVPHREPPRWSISQLYNLTITATASQKGFRPQQFSSDPRPLPKHCSLRFQARTDTPRPYRVYWQVVNTGDEARIASCLRGGYYDGIIEQGGPVRGESTLYSGMHWIECFIVKDGVCVARSGEFVVNIS